MEQLTQLPTLFAAGAMGLIEMRAPGDGDEELCYARELSG